MFYSKISTFKNFLELNEIKEISNVKLDSDKNYKYLELTRFDNEKFILKLTENANKYIKVGTCFKKILDKDVYSYEGEYFLGCLFDKSIDINITELPLLSADKFVVVVNFLKNYCLTILLKMKNSDEEKVLLFKQKLEYIVKKHSSTETTHKGKNWCIYEQSWLEYNSNPNKITLLSDLATTIQSYNSNKTTQFILGLIDIRLPYKIHQYYSCIDFGKYNNESISSILLKDEYYLYWAINNIEKFSIYHHSYYDFIMLKFRLFLCSDGENELNFFDFQQTINNNILMPIEFDELTINSFKQTYNINLIKNIILGKHFSIDLDGYQRPNTSSYYD